MHLENTVIEVGKLMVLTANNQRDLMQFSDQVSKALQEIQKTLYSLTHRLNKVEEKLAKLEEKK
jgi:hypothetical protein